MSDLLYTFLITRSFYKHCFYNFLLFNSQRCTTANSERHSEVYVTARK